MANDIYSVMFGVIILGLAIFGLWLFAKVAEIAHTAKEKKLRVKYPEYYNKMAERDKVYLVWSEKDKRTIAKEIDKLMMDLKYRPEVEHDEIKIKIEALRFQYVKAEQEEKEKREKVNRLHAEAMEIYHNSPELQKFYKWVE